MYGGHLFLSNIYACHCQIRVQGVEIGRVWGTRWRENYKAGKEEYCWQGEDGCSQNLCFRVPHCIFLILKILKDICNKLESLRSHFSGKVGR